MSDTLDQKETALISTGSPALATRSSALVRRGLEALASQQPRIVHFSSDRSMGSLSLYGPARDLERLGEARGEVTIPAGKKLVLGVSDEAVIDLSPISSLRPDDLQRLYIWGVVDEELVHIKHLRFLHPSLLPQGEKGQFD